MYLEAEVSHVKYLLPTSLVIMLTINVYIDLYLLFTFHRMGLLLFILPVLGVMTGLLSCYYKQELVWIRRQR